MIKLPSIMRILRKNIWNIYPTELELKKENQINKDSSFLDLGIKIQNSRFQQKFTNKRDNFDFNIIRIPYESNISYKMFDLAVSAEVP